MQRSQEAVIKEYISPSAVSAPLSLADMNRTESCSEKYDFEILIFSLIRLETDEKLKA